jgi:hypothetical protein
MHHAQPCAVLIVVHVLDRHVEFVALKMIDLFAKAIPGTILQ